MPKPWHETGAPPPPAGKWTLADLPPPAACPDAEEYHRRPALSWSGFRRFMGGGSDAGAAIFREKIDPTPPMRLGSLVGRIVDRGTSPAACGVIAVDARRGSTAWKVLPELVRRLADRFPAGWSLSPLGAPPRPDLIEVAVGSTKSRKTKGFRELVDRAERRDARPTPNEAGGDIFGFLPVLQGEWGAAVEFAQAMLEANPGAWASAPSPMIVTAAEWQEALDIAAQLDGDNPKAQLARGLLVGAPFNEYFVEKEIAVELLGEALICPECSAQLVIGSEPSDFGPAWECRCDRDWSRFTDFRIPDGEPVFVVNLHARSMLDALTIVAGTPAIVELKALYDPTPAKHGGEADKLVRQRNYAGQLDFYGEVLRAAWGLDFTPQGFLVVVGTQTPGVDVRRLDPLMERAQEKREEGLYEYARREAGLVPWAPSWQLADEVTPVEEWRGGR